MLKTYYVRIVSDIAFDGEQLYENNGYFNGTISIDTEWDDDKVLSEVAAYLACTGVRYSHISNLRFDAAYMEIYDTCFCEEVPLVYLCDYE